MESNIHHFTKTYYSFNDKAKFFIVPDKSFFLIKGSLGCCFLHLPSFYFYKIKQNEVSFIFLNKFYFFSFLKHLSYLYNRMFNFYFIKMSLRGLGYKIRRYGRYLLRFYFTMIDYLYLHLPRNVLCKHRKRRLLLISNNLSTLRTLMVQILLSKIRGGYSKYGFWHKRKIIFLRKRKKL